MALWTPTEIATALWLDAADAGTITDVSGAVSEWADKSGNGFVFDQVSAGNRPLYSATVNGLSALTFDGSNDRLSYDATLGGSPFPSGNGQYSVFVVARPHTVTSNKIMYSGGAFGTANAAYLFRVQNNGQLNDGWWGNNLATGDSAVSANTPFLSAFTYDGAGREIFVNGTSEATDTETTKNTGNGFDLIGAGGNAPTSGGVDSFFDGEICEIIVVAGAPGTVTRQLVEGYLAWKWGLESDLPLGHPYKDAAPTVAGGPTIGTQPADATVTQGETATFTVVASGTGTLTYQWYENGAFLLGENGNTLTVTGTLLRDGNEYTVAVTDDDGTIASEAATLTVNPASSIAPVLQGPPDVTVQEGQQAVFSVTAYGVGPFKYQWRVAGGANVPGATSRELAFTAYLRNDGAFYQVLVTDASGLVTASRQAQLTVTPEPIRGRGTADVDYPCALPGALVTANNYRSKSRVRRNDLASGPPIYQLEDDSGYEVFNVSWSFSAGQVQVFRNWFRCDLASGSRLFNIGLMVDGAATKGGRQTVLHSCYFDGVPEYTQRDRRWSVSATLLAIREEAVDCCSNLPELFDGFGGALGGAIDAFIDIWPPTPPEPTPDINPSPECQPYSCQALKTWFEEEYGRVWLDVYSAAATKAEHPYPFGAGSPYRRYFDAPLTGTTDWSSTNADSVVAPGGSEDPNAVFNPCGGAVQRVGLFATGGSGPSLTLSAGLIDTGIVAVVKPTTVFDGRWYVKSTRYAMYDAGGYIGATDLGVTVISEIVGSDHVFTVAVTGSGDSESDTISIPNASLLATLGNTFKPLVVQANASEPFQEGGNVYSNVSCYFRYGPLNLSVVRKHRVAVVGASTVTSFSLLGGGLYWATTFFNARCYVLAMGQVDASKTIDYDAVLLAYNRNQSGYTPPPSCFI